MSSAELAFWKRHVNRHTATVLSNAEGKRGKGKEGREGGHGVLEGRKRTRMNKPGTVMLEDGCIDYPHPMPKDKAGTTTLVNQWVEGPLHAGRLWPRWGLGKLTAFTARHLSS